MPSFTGMTEEAVNATCVAMEQTGEHYPIELNVSDFSALMHALKVAWEAQGWLGGEDVFYEWVYSFASGIAETLGVEWV